ncbi:MAG: hypothetical protein DHS20C09_04240 [marine bacterium B5-7]|nr:MAG: hypothetical protein DHS20C09_04240 [marine bacterium B5-7]
MRLKNKTTIITGSTSGIGFGIARGFAGEHMNIVMNGFDDADEIEKNRQELESLGAQVIYNAADMSKPEAVINMFEEAAQIFGSVGVVVNNAGISMASAYLPLVFKAVEINGENYWDGGYMGNPSLFPLFYKTDCRDIVIIHINPIERNSVPTTAPGIMNRINEISFNSSLNFWAR